jgi:diguanylate cyclase (GGDEF)-like protein
VRSDDLAPPHPNPHAARIGGGLLATGGLLVLILVAVSPGFVHGRTTPTTVIALVAMATGAWCMVLAQRVPFWMLPCIGPFGILLIGLSSLLTGTTSDGSELLYVWPVLFSAYFLSWRYATINVVLIALIYPPISISIIGTQGITPSVYLAGTSVVTLLIVASLRSQIQRVIAETALEARTDKLTGLSNRRSWDDGLAREIALQGRRNAPLCMLMIDLDHFKYLNDTGGHAAGDEALTRVAAALLGLARQTDLLARIGGEEFALALPDCRLSDAAIRAEQIRDAVERASVGWRTPLTVSIGVAALPLHATSAEDLMAAADAALYEAKRSGRNAVRVYVPADAAR